MNIVLFILIILFEKVVVGLDEKFAAFSGPSFSDPTFSDLSFSQSFSTYGRHSGRLNHHRSRFPSGKTTSKADGEDEVGKDAKYDDSDDLFKRKIWMLINHRKRR